MNIVVLLGGISPERNISLLSGRAITFALRERAHTVTAVDPSKGAHCVVSDDELRAATARPVTHEELAAFRTESLLECVMSDVFTGVDVVFIALHGRYGEDGYMQSLLDLRGIRYTGSGMMASAVAMDKIASKMLMAVAGVPSPTWAVIMREQVDDPEVYEEVLSELEGPLVVKPNEQGSSVGTTIGVEGIDALQKAVREAAAFSPTVLIERYVPGRELTVAVLGDEALPIIEIVPKQGEYDYQNKYTKGNTEYHCPAELSDEVQHHVQNLALAAHGVIGCRAYSRVDFRLTPDNLPFCLEVNTIPGFTETSLVPMAARAAGMEFGEVCESIIELSLRHAH
jgi:D-alanine-D-alanine ligase